VHRPRPFGTKELTARRKDGSEFPADIMLSPVQTDEGCLAVAVVRDVTERKRAEEQLRQSEERFRLLVDGVKDYAIFQLHPDGRVATWNTGAERIFGYDSSEILDRPFTEFYARDDIVRGRPAEDLALAGAHSHLDYEGWRVRKDGSRFWANVVTTALRDDSHGLRGFAQVTRDITQRKVAEEAVVLSITGVLLSQLDVRELLGAIAVSLRRVRPYDYANVALEEPGTTQMRVLALDSPYEDDPIHQGALIPLDGSPAGLTFRTGAPLLLEHVATTNFSREITARLAKADVKSACFLPLISRDRRLGSLNIYSRKDNDFSQRDVDLLTQVANQVASAIDNALTFRHIEKLTHQLVQEKEYLENELRTHTAFDEIIGESAALKRVLQEVEIVASTDASVLILGETGTGKELIARAIHKLSPRKPKQFVKVNCAAIPVGLLESELFGHEKGAFTGATSQKIGRLDLAHQGTLFLDEVGDIPLELQPKLLRVLQEHEFERLGSTRTVPVDVRIIAATNRNLEQMVAEGRFRDDLYYRLRVFPLTVPALRNRRDDIPLLVRYFVGKHAERMNKKIETVTPEVMHALTHWNWPGNVRELGNFLERAAILTRGPVLRVPLSELKSPNVAVTLPQSWTLETAERDAILRALRDANGVIGGPLGAAVRLGLKRTTLTAKMQRLGISRKDL
jgi:formate hydrogenlyase transcriptional activator